MSGYSALQVSLLFPTSETVAEIFKQGVLLSGGPVPLS